MLKIDGEVGNKKVYDPRSYLKAAEVAMADRVVEACETLRSTGKALRLTTRAPVVGRRSPGGAPPADGGQDGRMSPHGNLLGPEPTLLPVDPAAAEIDARRRPGRGRRRAPHVEHRVGGAGRARAARRRRRSPATRYARTGYHRGLDQLRRNGWKGFGPVPWSHEPNRGFLRALAALQRGRRGIGETDEAERCRTFLADSDPEAPAALGLS